MSGRAPVVFGRYLITRRLARGGMAEIYRAWCPERGWVALKLMRPALGHDDLRARLFEREARISAQLDHPNVVPVHDVGEAHGRPYLAMEFVRGRDLLHLLKNPRRGRGAPPVEVALWIAREAAAGLGHAHRLAAPDGRPLDIVHRDVSPGNVMVGFGGEVKVLDFGVARVNEASQSMETQNGVLRGKFAYMSPEQTRGEELDARSDVFSLGTVVYELMTGVSCFRAKDPLATLERVQVLRPAPPSRARSDISPRVDEVLARCLAKEPERRFRDGAEVAAAFDGLLDEIAAPGRSCVAAYMERLHGAARREESAALEGERLEIEGRAGEGTHDLEGSPLDHVDLRLSDHEEASREEVMLLRSLSSGSGASVFAGPADGEDVTEAITALAPSSTSATSNRGSGSIERAAPAAPRPTRPVHRWSAARRAAAITAAALLVAYVLGSPGGSPEPPPRAPGPTRIPPVTIELGPGFQGGPSPPLERRPASEVAALEPIVVDARGPRAAPANVETKTERRRPRRTRAEAPARRSPRAPPRAPHGNRRTGFLNIGAEPAAHISIDGRRWPEPTPQAGIELSVGVHEVELTNPDTGQTVRRKVRIAAGSYRTVRAELR